jgi:excinuclease ABC subunit B
LYADRVTDSMQRAIEETQRRRTLQEEYNRRHGITPETIKKSIRSGIEAEAAAHQKANAIVGRGEEVQYITDEYISELETEMFAAAEALEFERAAAIRDRIERLRDAVGKPMHEVEFKRGGASGEDAGEDGRRGRRRRGSGQRVPRPKRNA